MRQTRINLIKESIKTLKDTIRITYTDAHTRITNIITSRNDKDHATETPGITSPMRLRGGGNNEEELYFVPSEEEEEEKEEEDESEEESENTRNNLRNKDKITIGNTGLTTVEEEQEYEQGQEEEC
jgi:hypothetical protein